MVVVVVDANAIGAARYNENHLERLLSKLSDAGASARLVVPEIVVWEWAEHAYRDIAELGNLAKRNRQHTFLLDWLSSDISIPTVEDIVLKITSRIKSGEPSISLGLYEDGDGRAALKAQVLQVDCGSRTKGRIKTGAADRALASVAARAAEIAHPERVLVLTADTGLCEFIQSSMPRVEAVQDEQSLLLAAAPPSTEQIEQQHALRDQAEGMILAELNDPQSTTYRDVWKLTDRITQFGGGPPPYLEGWGSKRFELHAIRKLNVANLVLLSSKKVATLSIELQADVEAIYQEPVEFAPVHRSLHAAQVQIPAIVEIDDKLRIRGVDILSPANLQF